MAVTAMGPSDLDLARMRAMERDGQEDLAFYQRLADCPLYLLLSREAEGEVLDPQVFPLEEGPVVLAFDREERLAEFSGGVAAYAELPGRALAGLLAQSELGLALNLGSGAASEMILPADALRWMADWLAEGDVVAALDPAPQGAGPMPPPDEALAIITAAMARAPELWAALARGAALETRGEALVLRVIGADPAVEAALARAIAEHLRAEGLAGWPLDVGFGGAAGPGAALPWPVLAPTSAAETPVARLGPGMDPEKPPRLRI